MSHSHPVVQCAAITQYFGGVRALNDISLDLCAGQIVCLVGDNGAGKSTLVKILGGVHVKGGALLAAVVLDQLTQEHQEAHRKSLAQRERREAAA